MKNKITIKLNLHFFFARHGIVKIYQWFIIISLRVATGIKE